MKYLDNQVVGDSSGNAYAADGNGNPTTYKGQTLAFDPENRMTAYGVPVSGHATLTAGYAGDGMRAWKENASATRTYFLYDGSTLLAELGGTGALSAYSTTGANGLVSRRAGTTSSFFTYDPTGSVATVTNSAGAVQGDEVFNAVGSRENSYNSRPVDFCGQWGYYCDTETGLLLCGHRYYDTYTARFLNRDPIGFDGGINLYGYAKNNYVNDIDTLGFCGCPPDPFAGSSRVGGAAGTAIGVPVGIWIGRGLGSAYGPVGTYIGGIVGGAAGGFVGGLIGVGVANLLNPAFWQNAGGPDATCTQEDNDNDGLNAGINGAIEGGIAGGVVPILAL